MSIQFQSLLAALVFVAILLIVVTFLEDDRHKKKRKKEDFCMSDTPIPTITIKKSIKYDSLGRPIPERDENGRFISKNKISKKDATPKLSAMEKKHILKELEGMGCDLTS